MVTNVEQHRPAFEKHIRAATHKHLSKDFAVARHVDSEGRLLDYKKYETKIAWTWFVKGLKGEAE